MFIRKKDYEEMVRKYEEEINRCIREKARYEFEADNARKGIRNMLSWLRYVKDDPYVAEAIEKLKYYYIMADWNMDDIYEILKDKD